jgi:hypothetical protein
LLLPCFDVADLKQHHCQLHAHLMIPVEEAVANSVCSDCSGCGRKAVAKTVEKRSALSLMIEWPTATGSHAKAVDAELPPAMSQWTTAEEQVSPSRSLSCL